MKPVFLVGYMGSGKTTLGMALAEVMGCQFIDLDHYIEARFHNTISGLFAQHGEEKFRDIERRMLLEVANFENVIVACGGGTPCYFNNMQQMSEHGVTVFLTTSEERLLARLILPGAKQKRPLIANKSTEEIRAFIHDALAKRLPHYSKADITFDSTDIETAQTNANRAKDLAKALAESGKL